ncbi:MAG: SIMPL domain-containing protein [Pleurocapsa sp.]
MKFRWNQFKKQSIIIGTLIVLFISLALPTSAIAKNTETRVLTVTGEGKVIIPTTLTQIILGVEVRGETTTTVQQGVAEKSQQVVNFLRSREVQELKTAGISLQPTYDYNNGQKLIGYVGTNSVSFSLETSKIGDLLDEAIKVGATRIDQINFTATDTAIDTAQNQALQAAVRDAQAKAEAVLSALNFSTQDTIGIQINGTTMPQPIARNLEADSFAKNSEATTPVIGGEQTIFETVTLEITY